MTEADLTGEDPIFVDVNTSQQFSVREFDESKPHQTYGNTEETEATALADSGNTTETPAVTPTEMVVTERLRCPECHRFTAETEEKILRHIRSYHQGENPFQCYMCDYSTYNKSLFEEHIRIHRGIKPFKCSKCPYRSASKKNTKKHELIHRPDNPLLCKDCGFIARHPKALLRHQTMHEPTESLYSCPHCAFKCKTSVQLRTHGHNRRQCPDCDFVGCGQKSLNAHRTEEHEFVKKKKEVSKDKFQCALCEWSSSTNTKILLHLIHHPNQEVNEEVVDISVLRQCGIMT